MGGEILNLGAVGRSSAIPAGGESLAPKAWNVQSLGL